MNKNYIGKTCPYCKTKFSADDDVVLCGACDMPHHRSCFADNQGCTTFGCTGAMKEIAATPMPAPTTQTAAPIPADPPEKPIEVLTESKERTVMPGVHLMLENTALIIDRVKDKLYARCTFTSLSDKPVRAVMIEIACQDVWGNSLGEPVAFQYLDLRTGRESKFGQNVPIELPDKTTRKIRVTVKKLMLADDTLIDGGGETFRMTDPMPIAGQFDDAAMAAQFVRDTTPHAKFVPETMPSYWRCTCGAINGEAEAACHHCAIAKAKLFAAMNADTLAANLANFNAKKRALEEKARAEQAERDKRAREMEELARKRQEEEQLEAEKLAAAKKKRAVKICIAAGAGVLVIAIALAVIFWLIPAIQYNKACETMDSGDYEAAITMFEELDGFGDSAIMIRQSRYYMGVEALQSQQFDEAIAIFTELGDFSNSAELLDKAEADKELAAKEARYQEGMTALSERKYDEAIKIFTELGDFSDSRTKLADARRGKENAAKEAKYQDGIKALEEGRCDDAIAIFTELGDYAESKTKLEESKAKKEEMAKEAKYQEGIKALENKQFDNAIKIFTELGNYSDSKAKIIEAQNGKKEARYQQGINAMNNKMYGSAITIFTELGNYSDSKAKLAEAQQLKYGQRYEEGITALNNRRWDDAIEIFTELGNYSDSKSKLTEANYGKACNYMSATRYEDAYKLFKALGNYSDSKNKLTECIYAWVDYLLEKEVSSFIFEDTVTLTSEHYATIYSKIWNHINSHTDYEYWEGIISVTIYRLLEMLPSSYEQTATLLRLFDDWSAYIPSYWDYIRDNKAFLKSVWSIGFVRDFLTDDNNIAVFLESTWKTADGKYYFRFYEDTSDGSTWINYGTMPTPTKPYNVDHYNIISSTLVWEDYNDNNVGNVYRFSVIDFNTINVYCYADGKTYTLYRQ
ncbi:MAG: hypothetical protein E7632_07835 [Ruminococcaceae bacterium]|nr:hypothetical protein [Oscillospiraceae bacterium]